MTMALDPKMTEAVDRLFEDLKRAFLYQLATTEKTAFSLSGAVAATAENTLWHLSLQVERADVFVQPGTAPSPDRPRVAGDHYLAVLVGGPADGQRADVTWHRHHVRLPEATYVYEATDILDGSPEKNAQGLIVMRAAGTTHR